MLNITNIAVMNLENAMRGARNPMNSWGKSDSKYLCVHGYPEACFGNSCAGCSEYQYILGENDLDLAKRLVNSGTDHRKFIRQIIVSMDITAPLYWWKEFDTYKVGTVANSCSTMHKIHAKEFTLDDFSHEHLKTYHDGTSIGIEGRLFAPSDVLEFVIDALNHYRSLYLDTKNKEYWWNMIQLLPSSYNQLRTVTMIYENMSNMYHARKNHKLDEWHAFCSEIEKLPYAQELIIGE